MIDKNKLIKLLKQQVSYKRDYSYPTDADAYRGEGAENALEDLLSEVESGRLDTNDGLITAKQKEFVISALHQEDMSDAKLWLALEIMKSLTLLAKAE